MQITALRAIPKITSNLIQNSRRLFSFKFEMTPANRIVEQSDEPKPASTPAAEEKPKPAANFRYNVCQPRTSPVERPSIMGDHVEIHKRSVRAAIEEQQLQPSMLPEYYERHMEKSALVTPEPDATEEERINSARKPMKQRRFQVSKTCANASLPLKSVKLANPFPEPVKMMMSRTVSDEEKAEQMLADSKSQKSFADMAGKSQYRSFSTSKRWYSKTVDTDSNKCKKAKQEKKGGCPKMKLKGCPPRARSNCNRIAKDLHCKKQESPYPAYSEFCHEDIDEKPSECKLCPWKPEENPNFKPQKKSLHTSSELMLRRSGLELLLMEEKSPDLREVMMKAEIVKEKEDDEGMLCDLRKPPCDKPTNRRCPPPKKGKKEEAKKKKDKPKKAESFNSSLSLLLSDKPLPAGKAESILSLKAKSGQKKPDSCKVKKFKFPGCVSTRRKEEERVQDGCPVKKKVPKIRDCPPSDEDGKKCESLEEVLEGYCNKDEDRMERYNVRGSDRFQEYIMKDGDRKPKKEKCPKVDLTTWREEEEDPCHKKRKGTTKVCPGDLLKKKRRKPTKKADAVITPDKPKTEMPQPTKII